MQHSKIEVPEFKTSNVIQDASIYNSDSINLLDYIEILVKHCRMIVKVTVTAAILSIIYSLSLTKIYSSTARILPPQQENNIMGMMGALTGGVAGLASDLIGSGTTADLYVGILNSEAVSDIIIDRFRLMDIYKTKYRLDTYKLLEQKIDISVGKKSGIISITVEDKDPKRSAEIANAYVDELGKLIVKLNITGAGLNRRFYEEQVVKAKVDLARTEDNLKSFQNRHKIMDINQQAKVSIEGISQLRGQLAVQEIQLATIRRQFTENSQEVKGLKASIDNLRGQITRLEGTGEGGVIPNIGTVPELSREYLRLMREFKVQEAIYELLIKQYEMTQLTESKNVSTMQILQKAMVPDKKIKPKRSVLVIFVTLISGLAAALWAFIIEYAFRMPEKDRARWDSIKCSLHFNKLFRKKVA